MSNASVVELIDQLRTIARGAGEKIMEVYARDFDATKKDDQSPLTEADLAAHRYIVDRLKTLTPELPVLSEESSNVDNDERRTWRRYWLVDPLDGTKEFIRRNGEFTVNIALIEKNQATAGFVYAPARDLEYFGIVGHGAFRVEGDNDPEPITVAEKHKGPVRVVGSRSHRGSSLDGFLGGLEDYEMVPMGSSLKICLVADGSADVYPRLGPTSEWDTAAAHAVLAAAGGQLVSLDGAELRYNTGEGILNPHFMAAGDDAAEWLALL